MRRDAARWGLRRVCETTIARAQCFGFHMGSLAGAARLLETNADVLRQDQRGGKPRVEHKGTSLLEAAPVAGRLGGNPGLEIPCPIWRGTRVTEKLPQG